MKKAVSIKEIAEELGLSRNTVSKALNGQYVPSKTRELVLKKAQEMNYKSLNNQFLKSKRYRILLLSGKPYHNMDFFVPLVQSIENHCYDNNYDFFEYTYKASNTPFEKVKDYIKNLKIDGIVAIECFDIGFVTNLLETNIPICFIDFPGHKFEIKNKFDLLSLNNQKLICEYVLTLIDKYNLKKVCFVGDHRHCLSFHERYLGMIRALAKKNVPHSQNEDILCKDEEFDYGDTDALKNEIEKFNHVPDCFVCCNDFVARKVATALHQLGYEIPRQTMVLGFDGVNIAINESPQITSFLVDKEYLGKEAIRTLVSRIENKNSPTRTTLIDCDLIVRESTTK